MLLEPAKESIDVCLVVSDIGKSLEFYQRTLGLHKTEELETPYGTVHRLRYGTSLLKLIDPKRVPPAGPLGLENQLGFRFVCFSIKNLSSVCVALASSGVEFSVPETQVLPELRIAMVKDPDGNIVELAQHT